MKQKSIIPFLILILWLPSCYDDSFIRNQLNDHESRLTKLETLCSKLNANIISLQSICDALLNQESISSIDDIVENGLTIGYKITFNSGKTVTLYHGLNGIDGQSSLIGVALGDDGLYYWTINGDWILNEDGSKLLVTGHDGVSPKLKIEDEIWYVSYDDGQTWDSIGAAQVGDSDCACIFDSIAITDTEVIFHLSDGTSFKLLVSKTTSEEYRLKLGQDYEAVTGGVNALGMPIEGDNYWHSTPIEVYYGDVVEVQTKYQGAGMVIAQTDLDNSFFRVLCIHDKTLKYSVNIDFSGYISISYIKGLEPTEFKITRCKELQSAGIVINSADVSQVKNILRDSDNSRAIACTSFESESKAAYNKARFEQRMMLEDIAKMTADDILVSGKCGYNKEGDEIEDGTISWTIYKGGILHIKGYGRMYDFIKGASSCMNIAEVNTFVTKLGPLYWYYGFVAQNENNITTPFGPEGQKYLTDEVMSYQDKRYVPWGEDLNPLNDRPYGYAAPWYIYRTHVDDNYTSLSNYLKYNPQRITYNRVCIEEDIERGGITYIGNWSFYRISAQSLVLPSSVTSLGCWCIRYSPVLETLVMGDDVIHIEDHGVSRLESLRNINLSDSLTSIGYAGMENCPILEFIDCPSTLVSLGAYTFNGCYCLSYLDLGSVIELKKSIATHGALVSIKLPCDVQSIDEDAFYGNRLKVLRIPSNVANIEDNAFRNNKDMQVLVVESETILQKLKILNGSSADLLQQGAILAYCDWAVIPKDIYVPLIHKNFVHIGDDMQYQYFRRVVRKLNN